MPHETPDACGPEHTDGSKDMVDRVFEGPSETDAGSAEAAVPAPPRRRPRKRTRFAVPEPAAIAVRPLWEQASDEERAQAHRYAMAILESWTGRASWGEIAQRLDLPPVRVHQLSQQAVSGMLAGLLKQPRARRKWNDPPLPPLEPEQDPVLLRKRIRSLETKLERTEDLVRVLQEFPWHRGEKSAAPKRKQEGRGGKKSARRKARRRSAARPKAVPERAESRGPEGENAVDPGA